MLKIREAQMEAFQAYQRQRFRQGLEAHLKENYTLSDVTQIVDCSLKAAAGFGITMEEDILTLAELMAEEGPGFLEDPERPEAAQILSNPQIPEDAKMHLLVQRRPWKTLPTLEPVVEQEE